MAGWAPATAAMSRCRLNSRLRFESWWRPALRYAILLAKQQNPAAAEFQGKQNSEIRQVAFGRLAIINLSGAILPIKAAGAGIEID